MSELSDRFSGEDYARNLREIADDVREWGDATPKRVRKRCLRAEAEVERLRDALREVAAFEVDSYDDRDYCVARMRGIASVALDEEDKK